MRKPHWYATALVAVSLVLVALAPAASARTIIGTWTTTCTTYYFNVTGPGGAGNGSCANLGTAEGYTVVPATITVTAGNPGQGLAQTASAYCALVTPCPTNGATAARRVARGAQQSGNPPCSVPGNSGAQFANIGYVSPGVYSAAALVIGVTIGIGAASPSCSLAATASTIALSSTGKSFVIAYKGYSASMGSGLTYNRPFTYTIRYVLQAPKS